REGRQAGALHRRTRRPRARQAGPQRGQARHPVSRDPRRVPGQRPGRRRGAQPCRRDRRWVARLRLRRPVRRRGATRTGGPRAAARFAVAGRGTQCPAPARLLRGLDITVGRVITVIAHYRTRPEAADEVRALLARHSRASAAEAGCIEFRAHQDRDDPARFALIEAYDDEAAFAAHRRTDHFRMNIEQTLVPMLVEREWRVYGAPLT